MKEQEIKLTQKQKEILIKTQENIVYLEGEIQKAKQMQNSVLALIFDSSELEYNGQVIELKDNNLIIKEQKNGK